jgi:hypothetical protein
MLTRNCEFHRVYSPVFLKIQIRLIYSGTGCNASVTVSKICNPPPQTPNSGLTEYWTRVKKFKKKFTKKIIFRRRSRKIRKFCMLPSPLYPSRPTKGIYHPCPISLLRRMLIINSCFGPVYFKNL